MIGSLVLEMEVLAGIRSHWKGDVSQVSVENPSSPSGQSCRRCFDHERWVELGKDFQLTIGCANGLSGSLSDFDEQDRPPKAGIQPSFFFFFFSETGWNFVRVKVQYDSSDVDIVYI